MRGRRATTTAGALGEAPSSGRRGGRTADSSVETRVDHRKEESVNRVERVEENEWRRVEERRNQKVAKDSYTHRSEMKSKHGPKQGCDLSFPSNKLVSGDHCKLTVDEKSGQVTLEDTSTNGTVINKLQVVKKQAYALQSGDIIYLVYRKNEPEHNVAYLYKSLNEKQSLSQESLEANKENMFHVTKIPQVQGRVMTPRFCRCHPWLKHA